MNKNWQFLIKSILFLGLLVVLIAAPHFLNPSSEEKEGFQTTTQFDAVRGSVMTVDMMTLNNVIVTNGIVNPTISATFNIHGYDRAYFDPSNIKVGDPVVITAVDLEFGSMIDPIVGSNTNIKSLSVRSNINKITNKKSIFKALIVSYTERLQADDDNGSRYVATMVVNTITDVSPEFNTEKGIPSYYSVAYNTPMYPQCVRVESKDDEDIMGPEKGDESIYLDNYEIYNLEAPVAIDTTPLNKFDKTTMLVNFDIDAPIPWDYDLYDQDPKEILWGTVHSMTSKDIFNKCYTRFVLGSANNVEYNEVQKAYVYRSPIFGGKWSDPGQIAAIQLAEFYAQYKVGDIVEKITGDNLYNLWGRWLESTDMYKARQLIKAGRKAIKNHLKEHMFGYKKVDVTTIGWDGSRVRVQLKDANGVPMLDNGKPVYKQKWVKQKGFKIPVGEEAARISAAADDAAELVIRDLLPKIDNKIVREGGKVLTNAEKAKKGLKYFFQMELNAFKPLKNAAKGIVGRVSNQLNKIGLIGRTSVAAQAASLNAAAAASKNTAEAAKDAAKAATAAESAAQAAADVAKAAAAAAEAQRLADIAKAADAAAGSLSAAGAVADATKLATQSINATEAAMTGFSNLKLVLLRRFAPELAEKIAIALAKFGIGSVLCSKLSWALAMIHPMFWPLPITVEIGLAIISIGLVVLVPAIFSSFVPADAICPNDYPFNLADTVEQLNGGGWLWLIITSIPLIGDALGAFAPYICSSPSGACALKASPRNPSYFYDSSLSLFFNINKRGFAEGNIALTNPIHYYEHVLKDNPERPEKVYFSPEIEDPVIWIDFSEPQILDRMARYYYDMSRKMSQTNSDGSITFEYITKFYGIIGSSQYSCDVQCELEEITYWPFSGKIKCKRKVPNPDPKTATRYHDRRFYFYIDENAGIPMGERRKQKSNKYDMYYDNLVKYNISGCTHVNGTGIDALEISEEGGYIGDAMVSLGDPGSMYNPPKLYVRGSVTTMLMDQAKAPKSSRSDQYVLDDQNERKGQDLQGKAAADWVQKQILKKGIDNILVKSAAIPEDTTCDVVRSNLLKFGKVNSNPDLGSNVQMRENETFYSQFQRDPVATQWTTSDSKATKIFNVVYLPDSSAAQKTGNFFQTAITSCIGMASPTYGGLAATLAGIAGVSDYIACGYQDILSQAGTYIINGIVVTTDQRYIINRGPTVDYAPGYTPQYLSLSIADRCSSVKLQVADCTSRYSVRRAVNYYHTMYTDRRIKRIYDISLRHKGLNQSMCVYHLEYVSYNNKTYEEGIAAKAETIGMIYSKDDNDETCTFKPAAPPDTQFTTSIPPLQIIPQPEYVYDEVLAVLPPKNDSLQLRALRGAGCKASASLYNTCDDVFLQKHIVDMFNYSYNNFPQITKINGSSMSYDSTKNDYPICHYDVNYQYDFGQIVSDSRIISFHLAPGTLRRLPTDFIDRIFNTKNTITTSTYTFTEINKPTKDRSISLNVVDVSKFNIGDPVYVFQEPSSDLPNDITGYFYATVESATNTVIKTLTLKITNVDMTKDIFTGNNMVKRYLIFVIPKQDDLNNCLWDYTTENVKKKIIYNKVPKEGQWIDIPSLPPPVNENFIRDTCSLKKADGTGKYPQATLDAYSDCSGIAQISRLVNAFNIKYSSYVKGGPASTQPSRKILKVLRASTPKLNDGDPKNPNKLPICDYEVEMLRDVTSSLVKLPKTNTSVINQRETVRFYLKPYDENTGVTSGLVGTLIESVKSYLSPSEYKDCLYDYAGDESDTINSGYSIPRDSDETLFSTPYLWPVYFMDQANRIVNNAIHYYRGYDIEGTLKKTGIQSLNMTTTILSDVLANSYLGANTNGDIGPICDGISVIPGTAETNSPGIKTTIQQCRDPEMLRSIVNRYNYMNYPPYPGNQFGVEKRQIIEVRRAGVAEPYKCHLLLIEKIEFYKDFTKKPVKAVNITDPDVKYNERYFERRFQFPVKRKGANGIDRCKFYLDVGEADATTADTAMEKVYNKNKFTPYTNANNLMDISSNAFAIQSELSIVDMRLFEVDPNTGSEIYDNFFQGIDIRNINNNETKEILLAIKRKYEKQNVNTNLNTPAKNHKLNEIIAFFHPRPNIIELYVKVEHQIYNSMFNSWAKKAEDLTILVAEWNTDINISKDPNNPEYIYGKYNIDTNRLNPLDYEPDKITEYFYAWIDWIQINAENNTWIAKNNRQNLLSKVGEDITDKIPYIYYTKFTEPSLPVDSRITKYSTPYVFK